MASERTENEPNSTPKLSLSKLPNKLREPQIMATPPLNRLASIPFQWEEVPGKPRADFITITTTANTTSSLHNKNSVARCLELPPRLLHFTTTTTTTSEVINASSPTTVLDGPYGGPFLSQTRSFSSLPRGSFRKLLIDHEEIGSNKEISHQRLKFSSWRWGSFKENRGMAGAGDHSPSFSTCTGVSSKIPRHKSSAKISRVKKRSSFFSFSHAGSNLLSGVYGSLKQVVSWRH